VDQEQTLARLTRRPLSSKSLPKLKHMATTSMLIQRHSDLLLKLGRTDTSMPLCSHQITFKVNSLLQSSSLVVGITSPMTPADCGTDILVIQLHQGAQEGQAGSHWDSVPAIQVAQLSSHDV
jgi:hypothetical protein